MPVPPTGYRPNLSEKLRARSALRPPSSHSKPRRAWTDRAYLRRSLSPTEPPWCPIRGHNPHRGKGNVGAKSKDFLIAPSWRASVIARPPRADWGSHSSFPQERSAAEFALRDKSQGRNCQDTKSQPRNYDRIICGQFEHYGRPPGRASKNHPDMAARKKQANPAPSALPHPRRS